MVEADKEGRRGVCSSGATTAAMAGCSSLQLIIFAWPALRSDIVIHE